MKVKQMAKKCILCDKEAEYFIKGTTGGYCKNCAEDNFSDLECLQKAEEIAQNVKEMIDSKPPE